MLEPRAAGGRGGEIAGELELREGRLTGQGANSDLHSYRKGNPWKVLGRGQS